MLPSALQSTICYFGSVMSVSNNEQNKCFLSQMPEPNSNRLKCHSAPRYTMGRVVLINFWPSCVSAWKKSAASHLWCGANSRAALPTTNTFIPAWLAGQINGTVAKQTFSESRWVAAPKFASAAAGIDGRFIYSENQTTSQRFIRTSTFAVLTKHPLIWGLIPHVIAKSHIPIG
jgi:hypothetical protein